MPFKQVANTSRTPRRVLIQGAPNTGKTHSFLTWPRPAHYIALPGEKGSDTIPTGLPDLTAHFWESDPGEKTSSQAVIQAVDRLVFDTLAGKQGEVVSLMLDGLHKYYDHVLNMATGGAYFNGEEFEPKLYARAHEHFKYFLDRVLTTAVPYIVCTSWDGREADKPELKSMSPTHIFPDFPGKMAKRIMGEFPIVMYATIKYTQEGKVEGATWQLRPQGSVWGAAVKAPLEVVERLPLTIPQDFKVLEKVLQGAWESKPTVGTQGVRR